MQQQRIRKIEENCNSTISCDGNVPSKRSEFESSSEEEDFDHSEHFFQLSKQQYEAILRNDPNNLKIKMRLEQLINANYACKKQKTERSQHL
jgi:hypothetical protein